MYNVCIYIYMYTYFAYVYCIYIYIHIYIHTHTHIYTYRYHISLGWFKSLVLSSVPQDRANRSSRTWTSQPRAAPTARCLCFCRWDVVIFLGGFHNGWDILGQHFGLFGSWQNENLALKNGGRNSQEVDFTKKNGETCSESRNLGWFLHQNGPF
jgi:hypothetical protein